MTTPNDTVEVVIHLKTANYDSFLLKEYCAYYRNNVHGQYWCSENDFDGNTRVYIKTTRANAVRLKLKYDYT